MMVDKIENLEPPLAHMIPGRGPYGAPPVCQASSRCCIDWRQR